MIASTLQATIPHLSRSHRTAVSTPWRRLPLMKTAKPTEKKFKDQFIGYLHVDSCLPKCTEEEGKQYLFVAIDRTSKVALAEFSARQTGRRG
jgi:hypothetical protein